MKKAILIIAHKNQEQLEQLVNKFRKSSDFDVFVHIDKKWRDFHRDSFIDNTKESNCVLLNRRLSGTLDDYSLVEIALYLLSSAKGQGAYSYYILISGQDYPIKNVGLISENLDKSYPSPSIDCTRVQKDNYLFKHYDKWQFRVPHNLIYSFFKSKIVRRFCKAPFYFAEKLFSIVMSPYKYMLDKNIVPYGGAAWWILPDIIVNDILSSKERFSCFKHMKTPEEGYFQTQVMNSKFSNLVQMHPVDAREQNVLIYSHYYVPNKSKTGHPFIIEISDLERIKGLPHYFARKFDLNVDRAVLDEIDAFIES